MDEKYQKIELYRTYNLAEDKDTVEFNKNTIQELMKGTNIEYAFELIEENEILPDHKYTRKVYILNLIINKMDLERVKKLLDELKFTYSINGNIKENNFISDEIEETKSGVFAKSYIIVLFLLILIFEFILILYLIQKANYKSVIIMFVIIIIEYLILKRELKKLNKKKGK